MRKIIAILCLMMIMSLMGTTAHATYTISGDPDLAVLVDGRKVVFSDAKPFMDANNRVLVPIRSVAEKIGAQVNWSEADKTAEFQLKNRKVSLTLGQNRAYVNGAKVSLDTKAIIKSKRTYVPLRFVSEALGETVEWDGIGRWVWVGKKTIPSIEDSGAKLEDFAAYKSYFRDVTFILGIKEKAEQVHVFTINDLPMTIPTSIGTKYIIYDIWKVTDGKNVGLRMRYRNYDPNIYYLTKTFQPRYRYAMNDPVLADGSGYSTFKIINAVDNTIHGDVKYKDFKIESVDYIGLHTDGNIPSLLKNPFKK